MRRLVDCPDVSLSLRLRDLGVLPLATSLAEAVLALGKQVQPSGKIKPDAFAMQIVFSGYGALCKVAPIFPICLLHWRPLRSLSTGPCSAPASWCGRQWFTCSRRCG